MNERVIACRIVKHVVAAARGRRVHRIRLEIGKLSGVVPDAIVRCFPEIARGTSAEKACLDILEIDGCAYCEACETEFPLLDLSAMCPCGSLCFRPVTGEELILKSIDLEEMP
jgi:hydrogenase nickel incorporation protein HypA/HybF